MFGSKINQCFLRNGKLWLLKDINFNLLPLPYCTTMRFFFYVIHHIIFQILAVESPSHLLRHVFGNYKHIFQYIVSIALYICTNVSSGIFII